MRVKKLLFIFVLADILILALLYYLFFKPVKYRDESIDNIRSAFPAWKSEVYSSPTWKGRVYKSIFSKFGVYWYSPAEFEKFFSGLMIKMKDASYKADLPLFERGNFYYKKKEKEGFEFVIFFGRKGNVYWISFSGSTFFSRDIEILRKFFENLEVEGEKLSPNFSKDFQSVIKNIPTPKTKRGEFIFTFVFLIVIGSQLFILGLFHYIGRCPKELEGDIIVCSSNAYVETRGPLQVQIQPVCLCLKHGFLVVYMGGKKSMEIPIDDIKWNLGKKQGKYEDKIFKIPELNEWRVYLPIREFTDKS